MDSSVVLPALVAGRVLFSAIPFCNILQYDHQLTSPLTSYSHLQEGIYLFRNGIDPYSGGVFRHSPLFLSFFSTLLPNSRVTSSILWTLCDAVGAWALIQTWRARQRVRSSPKDDLIGALYLLNPYIFLPTLALSTSTFENTLTLLSIMFACQRQVSASLLTLALLIQLSLSSVVLVAPLLMLLVGDPISRLASPRPITSDLKRTIPIFIELVAYSCILVLASTLVTGGWTWIPQTWGVGLTLPDLTPNPGLWWYFFTEMFDHFRPFFLVIFSIHLLIYIFPVCIKFQHDPLYATFILLGVLGSFKPYLTLADPGLFLTMISLFPETFPYLRHPVVTTLLHLHSSLLLPLFHHLWLGQGTGNANFFYAITLVFGISNGAALIDSVYAGLRIAIGVEKDGFAVVQE